MKSIHSLPKKITKENFNTCWAARIAVSSNLNECLSKNEYKYINTSGRVPMISTLTYKMEFKKIAETYIMLKKNNNSVIDIEFINPLFLLKQIKKTLIKYRSNRRYIERD